MIRSIIITILNISQIVSNGFIFLNKKSIKMPMQTYIPLVCSYSRPVITFNFILKFTTKTLPNKKIVCGKKYIPSVLKKRGGEAGKKVDSTHQPMSPTSHPFHILFAFHSASHVTQKIYLLYTISFVTHCATKNVICLHKKTCYLLHKSAKKRVISLVVLQGH